MNMPSTGRVDSVRKSFPKGSRVRLVKMEDVQAPPPGTMGTVTGVDDMATIHVAWDNGSSLGVVYGEDRCVTV